MIWDGAEAMMLMLRNIIIMHHKHIVYVIVYLEKETKH